MSSSVFICLTYWHTIKSLFEWRLRQGPRYIRVQVLALHVVDLQLILLGIPQNLNTFKKKTEWRVFLALLREQADYWWCKSFLGILFPSLLSFCLWQRWHTCIPSPSPPYRELHQSDRPKNWSHSWNLLAYSYWHLSSGPDFCSWGLVQWKRKERTSSGNAQTELGGSYAGM